MQIYILSILSFLQLVVRLFDEIQIHSNQLIQNQSYLKHSKYLS